jgi:hypothetical protein
MTPRFHSKYPGQSAGLTLPSRKAKQNEVPFERSDP